MSDEIIVSQTFNRHEVTKEITSGTTKKTVTTAIVETAQEITLTQDAARVNTDSCVIVSETQNLSVFGDVVKIEGKLSLPGKDLIIIARRIVLENDSAGKPPSIVVDGPPLKEEVRTRAALEKGAQPDNFPWTKVKYGSNGAPAVYEFNVVRNAEDGQSAHRYPHEMNGEDGREGNPGNAGGNVKILCEKISQLQRLFEHLILGLKGKTRPDGPLSGPSLSFATVGSLAELPKDGLNLVIVAFVGPDLHIRIFDGARNKLVDKKESELVGGERLNALKTSFGISIPDALEAGGWATPNQLGTMSVQDQRKTLVEQMSRITSLPNALFNTLNDRDLAGRAAVIAFLLQTGIRDETGLKVDVKDLHNILVEEVARNCGRDRAFLQSLDNQQLVGLALEPGSSNQFVVRGGMLPIQDRQCGRLSLAEVLLAGRWASPNQLSIMSTERQRQSLIGQLSRITTLPYEVFDALNDRELAARGTVIAFLLQWGIRHEADLKITQDGDRNTLIVEVAGKCGYGFLQGVDNYELVRLALESKPENKFVLRGGMVRLRDKPLTLTSILEAAGWRNQDELGRMTEQQKRQALADELSRITTLPKGVFYTWRLVSHGEEEPSRVLVTKLTDRELIGRGAVIAFLLQMGIRDEAGLKVDCDLESFRKTYIAEVMRHVSVTDVLQAGKWRTSVQLQTISEPAQRQILVDELSRISGLPKELFNTLDDYTLIGRGLATAFLLQMGLRDEASLGVTLDNDRNTLIVEVAGKCSYPFLQGCHNQQLVGLALEGAEGNWVLGSKLSTLRDRLRNRWSSLAEKEQEQVVGHLASVLGVAVLPQFAISARGGVGGEGQTGQEGADGGNGGDALNYAVNRSLATPGAGGVGGKGGKGGKGGPGGPGGSVIVHLIRGGTKPSVELKGGDPGDPGSGGLCGQPGKAGRGGTYDEGTGAEPERGGSVTAPQHKWVTVPGGGFAGPSVDGLKGDKGSAGTDGSAHLTDGTELYLTPADLLANTRVNQLVMMWQRLRAEWVAIDPESNPAAVAELKARMEWVEKLLKAVPQSSPVDFSLAAAVLPGLLSVKVNTSAGRNYFGFGPYDVPAVSVSVYRGYLKTTLAEGGPLEKLEKNFNNYFDALRKQTDALASFDLVRKEGSDRKTSVDTYRGKLITHIRNEKNDIARLERQRKTDQQRLVPKLAAFGQDVVKRHLYLSPETFFNCLSQLSFVQEEHPVGGRLMVASQVGTMINDALTKVETDAGELVSKSYLLQNIKAFSSPDLKSDFRTYESGFMDPKESYQALASYDKLKKLLAEFVDTVPGALEVTRNIQAHIELIDNRNHHIDLYNDLLRQLTEIASELRRLEIQIQIASDGEARKQPGLAAMTNFVYGLYESVKTDCLEALHLLYRAQCFWLLKPPSEFHEVIGSSPEAITFSQLSKANNKLTFSLVSDLSKLENRPSHFAGILVVLTPEKHPEIFSRLKIFLEAKFHLAPATKKSVGPATILTPTAAAFTGDTLPDPDVPNPFYGKANVRLKKVRAWMVGMYTTNGEHLVNIEHDGNEMFWCADNTAYPPRPLDLESLNEQPMKIQDVPMVSHAKVRKEFVYRSEGLKLDLAARTFQRGEHIETDGDLGYSPEAELGLPGKEGFAAIGPFTTWKIEVPSSNPGLDLSKLSAIVMEFDGTNQGF